MSASTKRPTYCLIYWALEKTYSIGETKYISNAEMLYDPAIIGAIPHVGKATEKPQTGWPTYPGSVLFLSDKKLDIEKVADAKVAAYEEAKELAAKKIPCREDEESGAACSDGVQNASVFKKSNPSSKKKHSEESFSGNRSQKRKKTDHEYEKLLVKYMEQKEENLLLQRQQSNFKNEIFFEIREVVRKAITETLQKDTDIESISFKRQEQNAPLTPPTNKPQTPPPKPQIDQNKLYETKLALMEHATREQIENACRGSKPFTIVTANLMLAIFSEEELLTSNLKPDEKSEFPNVLDPVRVGKIIDYVRTRFGNEVEVRSIRMKMTYKLRDMRAAEKKKK